MEENVRPKTNKIIKIVFKILYQILIIMCLILTAVIILQRLSDSNRSIAGYRIFRVITGSMEPEYEVGEVVISKEVDPKSIKIGDDIVYLGAYGEYNGKIIMHNVIAIDKDENGNLNFHAKGLHSSSVEDPQIKENQIYGVVKYTSPVLTLLYKLATNIYSVFVIISILVLNVFIAFRNPKKEKIQKLNEAARLTDSEEIEIDENIENDEDVEEQDEEIYNDTDDEIEEDTEDENDEG